MGSLHMRFSCKVFLFAGFLGAFIPALQAQDSTKVNRSLQYSVHVFADIETGTNGMNQYMMNRLTFGGYMTDESIERAEKGIRKNNRIGLISSVGMFADIKGNDTSLSKWIPNVVGLMQENYFGSVISQGAWQLVFRGNGMYKGQSLDLSGTRFTQFSSRKLQFAWSGLRAKNAKGFNYTFYLGISQLLAYRNMSMTSGSLFTDGDVQFVEAQYSADFINTGAVKQSGAGWGAGLGFNMYKTLPNARYGITVEVRDLGFYQVQNAMHLTKNMDQSVRINQSSIGLKSLNTADWLEYLRDTVNQALAPDSAFENRTVLMPFRLGTSFSLGNYIFQLKYVYLPGYLPNLKLRHAKFNLHGNGFGVFPELSLGGFDIVNFDLNFNYSKSIANKHFFVGMQLRGIESMVLPKITHGAGASLQLSYYF